MVSKWVTSESIWNGSEFYDVKRGLLIPIKLWLGTHFWSKVADGKKIRDYFDIESIVNRTVYEN